MGHEGMKSSLVRHRGSLPEPLRSIDEARIAMTRWSDCRCDKSLPGLMIAMVAQRSVGLLYGGSILPAASRAGCDDRRRVRGVGAHTVGNLSDEECDPSGMRRLSLRPVSLRGGPSQHTPPTTICLSFFLLCYRPFALPRLVTSSA